MSQLLLEQLKYFRNLVRGKNFWVVLGVDVLLIVLAHSLAYQLCFSGQFYGPTFIQFATALPLLISIKVPVFYLFGLYRGMWRYTSISDLMNIIRACLVSFLIIIAVVVTILGNRFHGFASSFFPLDAILTFILIAGHRIAIRFFCQWRGRGGSLYSLISEEIAPVSRVPQKAKKRLLIIGAGDAAEQIIREVRNNKSLPYHIVGIVDDDRAKTGLRIHSVPVLGVVDDLGEHARRVRAEELLIAISSISSERMKRLNQLCQETGIEYKVVPGLGELIDGRVSIKAIRDIAYKDLLGRAEVHLDQEEVGSFLTGKTVMITGAGGSIGSELCRQIVRFQPAKIVLFEAGEENLYTIQMELEHDLGFSSCLPVLGGVQNFSLVDTIIGRYRPEVIFHTAAYKHVPLLELNPWEAVFNNILGTRCLVEAAIIHQVERFVLVSTDKAVRPTNVMGASKRLAELIMLACTRERWDGTMIHATPPKQHKTIFQAVRFGNVLGSSGSVVPLFKRQIEMGGPVTVTHPEITRYFMSIEEAARLIIQAGAMGKGGEIFILKMGEPVKIARMAREIIRLAGREPDTEIAIKYIGLRPGEKLYEELITEGEGIVPTHHSKIMVLRGDGRNYFRLNRQLEALKERARAFDSEGIKKVLKRIIPEYTPVEE